ncbi:unnamed protein product, partial [Nesidiocoris tenuis]
RNKIDTNTKYCTITHGYTIIIRNMLENASRAMTARKGGFNSDQCVGARPTGQTPIGNRIRPRTRKRIRQTNFQDNLKTRDRLLSKIIRNLPSRSKSPFNRLGLLVHRQFLCRGVPRIRISIIWKPDRKLETN